MSAISRFFYGWFITLRALRNPVNREILLGDNDESDYVEVKRPT